MAYCKNCGAYVPDGHTKCLACGLDQNEDKNKEYSSGYAAQTDPRQSSRPSQEEMRRQMEEQRKKQQEDSRRWAEAERQRRQREHEEEARRRREAETEAWAQPSAEPVRPKAAQSNKLLAALSYLSVLFVLPFIFCKEDKYAMFHARQGAILFAVTAIGEVLGAAFGLGWIVTLMHLYWIYKGMTNANDGKVEPLPYIGNLFSKQ